MAGVLVPDEQLDVLRSAPQPDPAPAPRPQLGQNFDQPDAMPPIAPWQPPQPVQGPYGASYDEGYRPATGQVSSQSESSPSVAINGDPIFGALQQVRGATNAGIHGITSSVLPYAGIDTSQLPWYEREPLNLATSPFALAGGNGLAGLPSSIGGAIGGGLTSGAANEYLPQDMNQTLRSSLVALAGIPGALFGGKAGEVTGRGASAFDAAIAPRSTAPEYGRTPESDSLFTAGPNGEVVGPTGNVAEMRLGREPVMGEDVNAGLRRTNYGRAQQEQLAAEEQAAFRDAGERAISGAVPDVGTPPLGGGSGASDAEFARLTAAADAEKAATGAVSAETHDALMNLLGERLGATPTAEQAAAREAFYRDPANLGGGQGLTPEAQQATEDLVKRADQKNVITDALAAAREPDPFARFETPNPDTLPEPNRTQPPPGYLERFRQPPAGGADVPTDEVPITPSNPFGLSGAEQASGAEPFGDIPGTPSGEPLAGPGLGDRVPQWMRNVGKNPVEALNNTDRSIGTALDVVSPVRLGFTAGAVHPAQYAQAVEDLGKVMVSKQPTKALQSIWNGYDANPDLAARGVTVDSMFNPNLGGMHGASYDPFSGERVPGGGLGYLAKIGDVGPVSEVGQRTQVLSMLNQIGKPAFLQADLSAGLADGSIPADFNLNPSDPNYARNVRIYHDLGQKTDLLFGHASIRPLGDATGTIMRFGNWFAAQGELYARALAGDVRSAVNAMPGVDVGAASPATQGAQQVMNRLLPLWGIVAVGLGLAQGIKPNDPRASKNFIPQIVINPTDGNGPRIPGFAPNTQWAPPILNYLGNLIGVGRGAYEGATGGSRFGGGAPTKGMGQVVGALKGGGGELGYWMRTQESKAVSLFQDLLTHSTITGEKPSLKNELPVPFIASPMLSENPRSPGVNIATNFTGGGFTEPSQRDKYALANFGKNFFSELEPNQKAGFVDTTPTDQQTASRQFTEQARQAVANAAAHMALGRDQNGQPYGAKDFRAVLNDQTAALRNQKEGVYASAGTKPGSDPVLDGYFKAVDAAIDDTGHLNGDALDAYKAGLDAKQQAYIDRNTGLTFKGIPAYDQYKADVKQIEDSGYWKIWDQQAQDYAKQLALPGVTNEKTLAAAIRDKILRENGDTPETRANLPLIESRYMRPYDRLVSAEHFTFLTAHPQIAKTLQTWGYGASAKALATIGAQ